jgi:integrase
MKRDSNVHLSRVNSAILYFFQINNDEFTLTIKNFKIHLPSDDSVNNDRPYTREEIEQVLQKGCSSDLRSKVIIYLLCGSGLRMGAISGLQVRDAIPMSYQGLNVYKIKVYARTRDEYYTFTTVESAKAIKDYLDYRERCHEQLNEKAPLIREQFNKDNPFTVNVPKFVTDKAIEYLIEQVLTRSGVRKPRVVHLSHGMRKYFVSTCESSPMKSLHVSMLSGHTTGIKQPYYFPKDSVVLDDFMTNAQDALTIDPTHRLKQENEELKKNQSDYLAELGDLRHDFNEMKQLLVHLSKDSQKELVDEFFEKVGDKADIEWS